MVLVANLLFPFCEKPQKNNNKDEIETQWGKRRKQKNLSERFPEYVINLVDFPYTSRMDPKDGGQKKIVEFVFKTVQSASGSFF